MSQEATLHIKINSTAARALKDLARRRRQTMGELVRQAIVACYQPSLLGLTREQGEAVAAYQGGYISLGRLAEAMGMHALEAREWLLEHGIAQNNRYGEEDAANA